MYDKFFSNAKILANEMLLCQFGWENDCHSTQIQKSKYIVIISFIIKQLNFMLKILEWLWNYINFHILIRTK